MRLGDQRMSALRRPLAWAFLAGASMTGAALSIGYAVRSQSLTLAVRLVPDTLVYLGAVCVNDSAGHARVRYFQQRVGR